MFTNRAFNIAFLISIAWHLFCMSAVNVVVLPGKYKTRELTSVSFLGPLLEKTALEIMLVNKPVSVDTTYHHSLRYTHSFDNKENLHGEDREGDEVKKHIQARLERIMDVMPPIPLSKDKEIPNTVKINKMRNAVIKDSTEISGSVAGRGIIYKPDRPELPSWVIASAPFMVELEFSVSAQGEIDEVVPVVSSGSPEVDLLGTRYLKAWKFAPIAPGLREEQKGRVKLVFGGK